MKGILRTVLQSRRQMQTWSHEGPTESLKRRVLELEKKRKQRNLKKSEFIVPVRDSNAYLDTFSMPMLLTYVAVAIACHLLMRYDDSKAEERIERKIRNAPDGQGTVRMLTREEWDSIQELRPRTPFESKLARPNARIRTGEPLHWEDVKDWTTDVLTDALTRVEESIKRSAH
ncbi:hypothetical protein Scep_017898 [Stephania cephalantha]|uniref:Uncharacterized protein n=1 Tax=Stephania cephalantha TaxID=152367 RepID=A0AAP0IRA9_9MAGN